MLKLHSLGSDDCRIIGHAINWLLNVPYEHSSPPHVSDGDISILLGLFHDVCELNRMCLLESKTVTIEVAEVYACEGERLKLPIATLHLAIQVLASFIDELRSSPYELKVITGVPIGKSVQCLSRLQSAYDCSLAE